MLQLMSTQDAKSVPEIVESLFESVLQVFSKDTENFYVVGYSFGALIALEIVTLLEARGKRGQLVLIDGAPNFLKKLVIDQMPSEHSDEAVQKVLINGNAFFFANASITCLIFLIILGIMRTIYPDEKIDVTQILTKYPTWEERLEMLLDMATDQYLYSTTYLRSMANCLFQRIKMVIDFKRDPSTILKSPITLIRPSEISIVDVEEDYGLHRLTQGNTEVKFVEGNHLTMLENPKLVHIINELDPALESNRSFKKHNAI